MVEGRVGLRPQTSTGVAPEGLSAGSSELFVLFLRRSGRAKRYRGKNVRDLLSRRT